MGLYYGISAQENIDKIESAKITPITSFDIINKYSDYEIVINNIGLSPVYVKRFIVENENGIAFENNWSQENQIRAFGFDELYKKLREIKKDGYIQINTINSGTYLGREEKFSIIRIEKKNEVPNDLLELFSTQMKGLSSEGRMRVQICDILKENCRWISHTLHFPA